MFNLRDDVRGIVAMTASMLALTLNFALVKVLADVVPIGEILFLRGVIAASILGVVAIGTGAHRNIRLMFHRTVIWRSVSESASAVFYFLALLRMPVANVTVLYQALPLVLTAAAALFLGEKVHLRRWVAILCGFVGVVIAIRPGASDYDVASLFMVMAVLFSVGRDIATRAMPAGIPTILVTIAGLTTLSLVGLMSAPAGQWIWPDAVSLLLLTAISVLLLSGQLCLVIAMRQGELSVISPFRYSSVVWAIVLDYVYWSNIISINMMIGAIIIISSGIYLSYRGRKGAGAAATLAKAPDGPER